MRLHISRHAHMRLKQRGITEDDLRACLASPHMVVASEEKNSVTYYGSGVSGRIVLVATMPPGYVDDTTTVVVKTAYWRDAE